MIDITDVIAVAAIIISVLTAWASLVSARKTAERQQTFELRFYRLSMLDPAKGKLQRIISDTNRCLGVVQMQGREPSPEEAVELLKKLDQLDGEAVDTFHAISHHLPPGKRNVLDAQRTVLEKSFMGQEQLNPTFVKNRIVYAQAVLQEVENCLQALLDNA